MSGVSRLNPDAEAYIPLSKRGATDANKGFKFPSKEGKGENQAVPLASGSATTVNQQIGTSVDSNISIQVAEQYNLDNYHFHEFHGSWSHNPYEMMKKQFYDEDFDMELAYLEMTFPGISHESLYDVYLANKGDLEAAVEMLNQLEIYSVDSMEKLPDTLDIGDVSETVRSADFPHLKAEKVTGESSAVASSSGSAGFNPIG